MLIVLGVTSFARIATVLPWLDPVMRYAGAAFLGWYGWRAARSALRSTEALVVAGRAEPAPLGRVLATCLALTWLNPHVYLDTVVLLGTIATRFPGNELSFATGAVTGSFAFFVTLGYGARLLRPLFANPTAWRVLDGLVALVMWAIAIKLVVLPKGYAADCAVAPRAAQAIRLAAIGLAA